MPSDLPPAAAGAPRTPAVGIAELPDDDDALAALYAWPTGDRAVVRANMIASLDGGIAVDGKSAGLGNSADESLFGLLRDLADVILVGSGTVRAEKYAGIRLSDRRRKRRERWGLPAAPPPIAVITGRGLDHASPLFTDTETPPIVVTTESGAAGVPAGIRTIVAGTGHVDSATAIAALAGDGYRRIHCEGGPVVLAAIVEAGVLDECCLTLAPMLLGSRAARMLPAALADPSRWELATARRSGSHLFTQYRTVGSIGSTSSIGTVGP